MKKYLYFNTNENHWFYVAKKLYEDKIAEPVFWLGADNHYQKASQLFGENVVKSQSFIHRPYEFQELNYRGENNNFFFSKNYLRAKDRCLKMMDRLDLYGVFSRLDREVYFHNLCIYLLKKFEGLNADVLITAEAPHDHSKYIAFEICKFLNIPCYKFQNWMPAPLLYLQNMETDEIIKLKKERTNKIDRKAESDISKFIHEVKNKSVEFEPYYMKSLRENEQSFSRFLNFFKKSYLSTNWFSIYLDIRHNTGRLLLRKYNPINPFYFTYLLRYWNNLLRRKNLNKAASISHSKPNLNKKFVYFPLHFEPERTTNPDGNDFQDQFIALTKLRQLVPSNINIIIKEHPTQLRTHFTRGILGRSPLFYKLIKNIKGLQIVKPTFNSIELILKSELVSTITGTVALESAILGKKALTFGSTYFDGCPNIQKWNEKITYKEITNSKIHSSEVVESFLISKKRETSVTAFQNGSQRNFFKRYKSIEFDNYQLEGTYDLLKSLFENEYINSKISDKSNLYSPWANINRPLLIAEIGGNHEGDFNKAKKLLKLAIESGVDCVKFQIYSAESLVSKIEDPNRYSHFKKFELTKDEHIELATICKNNGVLYTSSVWSEDFIDWIDPHLNFYKIGSGDMTAYPIIKKIVEKRKPIVISTGLSSMNEVLDTVKFIQNTDSIYNNKEMLCILQCTSMYPIPESDVNLNVMSEYKKQTNLSVGYSDHTEGVEALKIAATLNAQVLEFHFTDHRDGKTFRDHKVSLTKDEVQSLISFIKSLETIKGDAKKEILQIELDNNHNISFRRGVYLNKDLNKGQIIKKEDLVFLRPAVGTDSRKYSEVIGSKVLKDVKSLNAIREGVDYKKI